MPHDVSRDRVLVVGEALVDVVLSVVEPVETTPVETTPVETTPVETTRVETAIPGGSPLNVAVGLCRLGVPATLHSSFGADAHGVAIAQHLEASGVSVTPGTVRDQPTSVALATIAADGSASYTFSIDWDPAPLDVPEGTFSAVHTGSIGAALEPGATMVENLLTLLQPSAIITFDPNVRPQLMGTAEQALPRIERLVALADVVKASDEDVAWLYPDRSVAEVLQRWCSLGPALCVITRGADGVDALAASGPVHVPVFETVLADTIGAGDSFMSGLIWAMSTMGLLDVRRRPILRDLPSLDVRVLVTTGARCAGITVGRPGAAPPTADEVAAAHA
ncbi:MAG: carbohydrate kinase [Pseudolysinimonas sp.]